MAPRLDSLTGDAATQGQAAQYAALASGQAVGGNFGQFQAAVAEGFVSDDPQGYNTYLAWNSLGTIQQLQRNRADFAIWNMAANLAYAVSVGQRPSANQPPLSAAQAQDQGLKGVAGIGQNAGWDSARIGQEQQRFVTWFAALLNRLGSPTPAPTFDPTAYETVASPVGSARIPKSWVVSDTVDPATGSRTLVYNANGVGPQVTITGAATNAPPPVPLRTVVQIVATNDPALGGSPYRFPTLAWRTIGQRGTGGQWEPGTATAWRSWKSGVLDKLSSADTSAVFWHDVQDEVEGDGTGRVRAFWDFDNLVVAVNGPAPGTAPPNASSIDVVAKPETPNVREWTDVTAPEPPPTSGIGPGSPKDGNTFAPPSSVKTPPLTTDQVLTMPLPEPAKPTPEVVVDKTVDAMADTLTVVGIIVVLLAIMSRAKG